MSLVCSIFNVCATAAQNNVLIERESSRDKEFHFQNWFRTRLNELGEHYDEPGRNVYPDFRLVNHPEGYELKGLAYPGRKGTYDCNSRVPFGEHNGRQVYYVFGRYPSRPDGEKFPVLDLVICHGSFFNAVSSYEHKNKSFKSFGSYGDIMVRDRKMYAAPTPYALAEGTAHHRTLILPAETPVESGLVEVSTLRRREADKIVTSYTFDLQTNELSTDLIDNPNAGKVHIFKAYRKEGDPLNPVTLVE